MKRTAALVTCLALLIPGAAIASANPTSSSYSSNNTAHKVDNASASRTPSSPSTSATTSPSAVQNANATRSTTTGSLPFTGLDVGALAGGAVVLLGAGLLLRRVSSTDRR